MCKVIPTLLARIITISTNESARTSFCCIPSYTEKRLTHTILHQAVVFIILDSWTNTVTMAGLILIPINDTVHLGHSIRPDGIVIFRSSRLNMSSLVEGCRLDLISSNGDTVLHIGFRRTENAIVFNACSSGNWLREERIKFGEILRGNNHTITIYNHNDNYQILFNGKTSHYFKKQLPADATSLAYHGSEPLFSDPIVAETYTNLTALVAGLD